MTRAEAEQHCRELNAGARPAEAPWIAREVEPGDWRPARPRIAGMPEREPYTATTEAKPRPPEPDDPRDALNRNIPGYNG